jgi:hypothetical protein
VSDPELHSVTAGAKKNKYNTYGIFLNFAEKESEFTLSAMGERKSDNGIKKNVEKKHKNM